MESVAECKTKNAKWTLPALIMWISLHSTKESIVIMWVFHLELHALQVPPRIDSSYSMYTVCLVNAYYYVCKNHIKTISTCHIKLWEVFSTSILCEKYKNFTVCGKSTWYPYFFSESVFLMAWPGLSLVMQCNISDMWKNKAYTIINRLHHCTSSSQWAGWDDDIQWGELLLLRVKINLVQPSSMTKECSGGGGLSCRALCNSISTRFDRIH